MGSVSAWADAFGSAWAVAWGGGSAPIPIEPVEPPLTNPQNQRTKTYAYDIDRIERKRYGAVTQKYHSTDLRIEREDLDFLDALPYILRIIDDET